MELFSFGGIHVFSDVSHIDDHRVTDHPLILAALERGIAASGATICDLSVKEFEPAGLTALYLLSESHVSVHTYPEQNSLFVDAFTCGESCEPQRIIDSLLQALGACEHRSSRVHRGLPRATHRRLRTPRPLLDIAS